MTCRFWDFSKEPQRGRERGREGEGGMRSAV